MKKPTAKSQRNKADRLWSLAIRAKGECERCSRRPPEVVLQGAHIVPRRYLKTRWDLANGLSLCNACHVYFTHFPIEFEDFVVDLLGDNKYQALRAKARGTAGKVDYDSIIAALVLQLEELDVA